MNFQFLFFLLFGAPFAKAEVPKISGDISQIVSSDSWKDTQYRTDVSPYFRFRAILFAPIKSESGSELFVEKIYKGGVSSDYEFRFRKKIDLLANKTMKAEFKKKSLESRMGCCHPREIKWKGFQLSYSVRIIQKYHCVLKNVNLSQIPVCRVLK